MGVSLDKYFVKDRNGYYLEKTSGKYSVMVTGNIKSGAIDAQMS